MFGIGCSKLWVHQDELVLWLLEKSKSIEICNPNDVSSLHSVLLQHDLNAFFEMVECIINELVLSIRDQDPSKARSLNLVSFFMLPILHSAAS